MNLELIKKYEKEFLHMLHGGNILVKYIDKENAPNKDYLDWHSDNDVFESNLDYLIVIDDMYSHYRKAVAEGKTVQYKGLSTQTWCTIQPELGHTFGVMHVSNYRIKPEEPKFKVGDWITVNGPAGTFIECVSGINDDTYVLSGTNICYKSQASKWNPTRGEVCIVWANDDICSAAIVRFDYIDTAGQYRSTDNSWWDNCMPFTGTLPPHMKDNK